MWTRDKTIVPVTVMVLTVRMQLVCVVTLLLIITMAGARHSHHQELASQEAVESVPKSPCPAPPLTPATTGCCSERCQSWDECLECAYENYWLCVDQLGDTRQCTAVQDEEKAACYDNCY